MKGAGQGGIGADLTHSYMYHEPCSAGWRNQARQARLPRMRLPKPLAPMAPLVEKVRLLRSTPGSGQDPPFPFCVGTIQETADTCHTRTGKEEITAVRAHVGLRSPRGRTRFLQPLGCSSSDSYSVYGAHPSPQTPELGASGAKMKTLMPRACGASASCRGTE